MSTTKKAEVRWTQEQKDNLSKALKAEAAARKAILTKYDAEYQAAIDAERAKMGLGPREEKKTLSVQESAARLAKKAGVDAEELQAWLDSRGKTA